MRDSSYPYFNVFQVTNPEDYVIFTRRGVLHFAESATKEPKEGITDDQSKPKGSLRGPKEALRP